MPGAKLGLSKCKLQTDYSAFALPADIGTVQEIMLQAWHSWYYLTCGLLLA